MSEKVALSFSAISEALYTFPLPETDWVIGIGRGGVVPASLVAHQLQCGLIIVQLNYRDDDNNPSYEDPVWVRESLPDFTPNARILLVDDVSVSGKTLEAAKTRLADYQVSTFVLKGKADYVLFPDIKTCVNWPWKAVDYAI
uniref:Phosphoribosyltransferase family protein n=1 Tax=Roseihalotalea indica TaxID=2867963 RepID=A0AA49GNW1_9BACT|nr:phosphoribosyltransferase family protein [Tunicatimonas sp. TK19036]